MFWTTVALMATLAFAGASTVRMLGAPTDADINNPDVRNALNFAVNELNDQSTVYISKVAKVLKAQSQVVSGALYTFEVEMSIDGCKLSAAHELCDVSRELTKPYICTFKVWSQPWMSPPMATENACEK